MIRSVAVASVALVLALPAIAQEPGRDDPMARFFYPPELVMSHQRALGLDDAQRNAILGHVRTLQGTVAPLQFRLAGEAERLGELLRAPAVDEAAVLAQLDRVLPVEREIKRAQIAMMIRIRNALTEQQRAQLDALRAGGRSPTPDGL